PCSVPVISLVFLQCCCLAHDRAAGRVSPAGRNILSKTDHTTNQNRRIISPDRRRPCNRPDVEMPVCASPSGRPILLYCTVWVNGSPGHLVAAQEQLESRRRGQFSRLLPAFCDAEFFVRYISICFMHQAQRSLPTTDCDCCFQH